MAALLPPSQPTTSTISCHLQCRCPQLWWNQCWWTGMYMSGFSMVFLLTYFISACQRCSKLKKFHWFKKAVGSCGRSVLRPQICGSCNGSDLLKLSSTFVRTRTFVTDFGNDTKVPAAASILQGTTGWREGWGTGHFMGSISVLPSTVFLWLLLPCGPQILQLSNFKVWFEACWSQR